MGKHSRYRNIFFQRGMTLLELSIVLLILVTLAGVVVPYLGSSSDRAACVSTDATLANIRDAIMGGATGGGFYNDMLPHRLPDNDGDGAYNLHYLFAQAANPGFDPVTAVGWNGPYLQHGTLANVAALSARFTDSAQGYVNDAIAANHEVALDGYRQFQNPVILQVPAAVGLARLVSAGPNGVLETSLVDANANNRGDDRVLYLMMADPGANEACGA